MEVGGGATKARFSLPSLLPHLPPVFLLLFLFNLNILYFKAERRKQYQLLILRNSPCLRCVLSKKPRSCSHYPSITNCSKTILQCLSRHFCGGLLSRMCCNLGLQVHLWCARIHGNPGRYGRGCVWYPPERFAEGLAFASAWFAMMSSFLVSAWRFPSMQRI